MKSLEKYQAKKAIDNEVTAPAEKRARSRKFLKKDNSKEENSYVGAETEAQSAGKLKALMKKLES